MSRSGDGQLTGHRVWRQWQELRQSHMRDHLGGQPDRHTAGSKVGWPAGHGGCRLMARTAQRAAGFLGCPASLAEEAERRA